MTDLKIARQGAPVHSTGTRHGADGGGAVPVFVAAEPPPASAAPGRPFAWALSFTLSVYPILVAASLLLWAADLRAGLTASHASGFDSDLHAVVVFSLVSSAFAGAVGTVLGSVWAAQKGGFSKARMAGAAFVGFILFATTPFWILVLHFGPALLFALHWVVAPGTLLVLGILSLGVARKFLADSWPTSLSVVIGLVFVFGSTLALLLGAIGGMSGAGIAVVTFALVAGLGSSGKRGAATPRAGILRRIAGALLLGFGVSLLDVSALYLVGATMEGLT